MADTETILNDKTLSRADDQGKPDRAKSLALAAVDDGFQEHVKLLLKNAAETNDPAAVARAMVGYRRGRDAWLEFRKQINADGG